MTNQKAIGAFEMCRALMLFDAIHGESETYESLNQDNKDLYDACGLAIKILLKDQTNSDLISRAALLESMGQHTELDGNQRAAQVLECILDAPAIDAVPVVRCMECAKSKEIANQRSGQIIYCKFFNEPMNKTDYCIYGERLSQGGAHRLMTWKHEFSSPHKRHIC